MTPQSDTLMPCPFCGGEARSHLYIRDGSKVQCTNYHCQGAVTAYQPNAVEKAIAAWNTRSTRPTTETLREALGTANDHLNNAAHILRSKGWEAVAAELEEVAAKGRDALSKGRG